MAATRSIELRTEVPGPRSRAILERKERVIAAPLAVVFPIVAAVRERRPAHRRRRQHLRRLHRGRRLPERRPLASAGGRRGRGAARPLRPHRLHDRPVRAVRRAGGAAAGAVAAHRTGEGGVLQRRHGGGRERGQVRTQLHRPPGGDRVRGRLPRPHAALAVADLQDASLQGRSRPVRARGLPRAVRERLPRARRRRGSGGTPARAGHPGRGRDGGCDRRRTGPGRGRLRGRAAGVHGGNPPDLRRQRHRHGRRRGADRFRPDRAASSRSSTTTSSRT